MLRFIKKKKHALACALTYLCLTANAAEAASVVRDAEIESVIRDIFDPILTAAGRTPDSVDLYIVNDPSVNAFVQGGQKIFLHTGLLIALESPDQLAGVLAHELGHITGGHLLRAQDAATASTINALITGAAVGVAAVLSGAGGDAVAGGILAGTHVGGGVFNSFSRTQESAADRAALVYLQKAGISPNGMLSVLNMLAADERGARNYMRSHPLSRDRIAALQDMITSPADKNLSAPPRTIDYDRLRAKLYGFLEKPEQVLARYVPGSKTYDPTVIAVARASALHKAGDSRQARQIMRDITDQYPNDPFLADLAGQIFLETGDRQQAVAYYRKAYKLSKKDPLIGLAYGQALTSLETPDALTKAAGVLRQSLRAEPYYARGFRDLSIVYDRLAAPGKAALYSAEYFILTGNRASATSQASRAVTLLPQGTPDRLRAEDILLFTRQKPTS